MAFIPGSVADKFSSNATDISGAFKPGLVADKYKSSTTINTSTFQPGSIATKYAGRASNNLDDAQGLYNLAVKSGLQSQADSIMKQQAGEKPNQIFSGGFISDIFDTLNALDHGVVGLLKGKSFSEGVVNRESFTGQDALGGKGIPGMILGTVLDIAVDPLTYIAPETILEKVPGLTKAATLLKEAAFGKLATKTLDAGLETEKTYQALEGGTKLGKYLGDKFVWMFGKDPIFRDTIERGTKNIEVGTQNIVDLTKDVAKIAPETAAKILSKDATGRFIRTPLNQLSSVLSSKEIEPVAQLYAKIDELGKKAVDLGLLTKDTYEEHLGEYIKNAYTEYEQASPKLFPSSNIGIKGIKNRVEGLTEEEMAKLGQIKNPAYLLFKSAFDLNKDVQNGILLKDISDKFGTKVAQEGFTLMPTGKRLGALAGKYIPEDMARYLEPIVNPDPQTLSKNLVANFKFAKVIMNPGTHARNIVSNTLLNWWKLGLGPWRADVYAEALNQTVRGGKWVDEAKTAGYGLDTFAAAEMKGLLNSPEASILGKASGAWSKTKQFLGDIYQKEENVAKLAAFIHQRKAGYGIEEAWKAAESATFNYAQVTPFVRKLRTSIWGLPFVTFTAKATPVIAETALKNPGRISVLGKIKQGIENQANPEELAKERASEPPWVKDGFYVKLPIKDKEGRSAYFDLTYILPFGDLISGNFLDSAIKRDTGLPDNPAVSLATKSPLINFVKEITSNQDFYGNKIWKETDPPEKQLKDLLRHTVKAYAPPIVGDLLPGGYNDKGERQTRGIVGALQPKTTPDQNRTLSEELLRMVGLKTQPVSADIQSTLQDWNTKKALTALLLENFKDTGLKEFNRLYIPKK